MSEFEYRKYTRGCNMDSAVTMMASNHLYVAAAFHDLGFIPGFFDPATETCEIPWGCESHIKEEFYILHMKTGSYLWSPDKDGKVPNGSIKGGYSERGETLYIGRFKLRDKWICGKIHPSHRVCYVADEGCERNNRRYLVLSSRDDNPITTLPEPEELER